MTKKSGSNWAGKAREQVRKHNSDDLKRLHYGNNEFQQDVQKLRRRFSIPSNGYKMYLPLNDAEKVKAKYITNKPNPIIEKFRKQQNKAWQEAVNSLLIKHGLSLQLYNVMDWYLLFNETRFFKSDFFLLASGNLKVEWRFYQTDQGVKMRKEIVITNHLTQNEYEALKQLQNEVFGKRKKRRVRKNIDRDIAIVNQTKLEEEGGDRGMTLDIFPDETSNEGTYTKEDEDKQVQVIKQARRRMKK